MTEKDEVKQIATYNGRKYQLMFRGQTRFGERARLKFLNGAQEFWVNARLVTLDDDRGAVGDVRLGGKPSAPPSGGQPAPAGVGRCPDPAIANQIISTGLTPLVRYYGADPDKVKLVNACAAWLRDQVRGLCG